MGIPVLIQGESGSGKSASMRNFDANELAVFSVSSKPLPFRKKIPIQRGANYASILKELSSPTKNKYVIDDSQFLMVYENFARVKETGYAKFTDMALHFIQLVNFVINQTPNDCIVYFLHHTDTDDNGNTKAQTIGKMIDNQLGKLESLFTIVLNCEVRDGKHLFITQSDGTTTCKSPMEMFPLEIDNDLKMVDTTIREYYELNDFKIEKEK